MKASTPLLLSTIAMIGFSLLAAPSVARADLIFGPYDCVTSVQECDNGQDDDLDSGFDYDGDDGREPLDADCVGRHDVSEELPGKQDATLTCRSGVIRIEHPQGFLLPRPPICPVDECGVFELIDLGLLLRAPLYQVLESGPKDFKVSTPGNLTKQVPGILDRPDIPNLRFEYIGKHQILGPAVVGEIKLRAPFFFPSNIKYVGRAFNTESGQSVTNVGTLTPDTTQAPVVRPLVILLGLALLSGVVAGAVWWYRSRRRAR